MQTLAAQHVVDRVVTVVATERGDGDVHPLRVAADDLAERQIRTTGRRWAMLDQRHGTRRVCAVTSGAATIGIGDVLVSDDPDLALAVWAADCAVVIIVTADGRRVAAHAGWRGLAGGVIDVAVEALESRPVALAVVGPMIGPCCYAFGDEELRRVAAGVGADPEEIMATTSSGEPSLDVPAAIDIALGRHGLTAERHGSCTRCDDRWYSHRRGDLARHAVVAVGERVQ